MEMSLLRLKLIFKNSTVGGKLIQFFLKIINLAVKILGFLEDLKRISNGRRHRAFIIKKNPSGFKDEFLRILDAARRRRNFAKQRHQIDKLIPLQSARPKKGGAPFEQPVCFFARI